MINSHLKINESLASGDKSIWVCHGTWGGAFLLGDRQMSERKDLAGKRGRNVRLLRE